MKKIMLLSVIFWFTTIFTYAQEQKYQLSSHILDIAKGQPATNVKISLFKQNNIGNWVLIDEKITDKNGRINNFLKEEAGNANLGVYKLTFYTASYFEKIGQVSFYPFVDVVFEIKDHSHYHVPITLSAYGYSTYRGN